MASVTHINGKDAPLEETISNTIALLEQTGLKVEAKSWLNPAPHCWSVHLQSASYPALYTNGKGTSKLACLASALGEFVERLATNFFFSDSYLEQSNQSAPFFFHPGEKWFQPENNTAIPRYNHNGAELLTPELLKFYNPENELSADQLLDNNSDAAKRGICALPFQELNTADTIYFPVSFLNNLYVSNGMAAGNSPTECSSQALSEIIERYVKNIIIAKGVSLPDVPRSELNKFPILIKILDKLNSHNFTVQVKDASLGGRYPVICVILTNLSDGGVYASFGANVRFETAVERTLTELLQGRDLHQLQSFQPPSHDLVSVADPFNLESHFINSDGLLSWEMFKEETDYIFHKWNFIGSTEQEFNKLTELITNDGFTIYRAEYLQHGMYCCRILVPGMSEIYPLDDLMWNNKSSGAQLRQHLLNLPSKPRHELEQILTLLDELGFSDFQLVADIIGVTFDEESNWSTLRIGELKLLICLALEQQQDALAWCNWCVEFGALPEKKRRFFQVLQHLLNFALAGKVVENYKKHLQRFYSENEIHQAESVVCGIDTFPGLSFGERWEDISNTHRRILEVYSAVKMAHLR